MKKFKKMVSVVLVLAVCLSMLTVSVSAASHSTVKYGSKGSAVITLQAYLNKVENAGLVVDGSFGNATLKAVKNFQAANGLTVDGIVGPATWKVLENKHNQNRSSIIIGSGKYNPGTILQGNSYSISGKVNSIYKITSLTVGVYKNGNKVVQSKTVYPNSSTYNIRNVDNYIKFGKIPAGNYTFKVTATDSLGFTKTVVSNGFTVKALLPSTFANTQSVVRTYSLRENGNYQISTNFKVREFRCKDGSDYILIDDKLAALLQDIRDHFGKPVTINSAYRTVSHNEAEGGATNSYHVKGMAADIQVEGVAPIDVAKYAESIGVKGIGLYSGFVHVDTRTSKSYWKTSDIIIVSRFQ